MEVLQNIQVTSKKDQKQYWFHRDEPYRFVTAKEFYDAYQSFHVDLNYKLNLQSHMKKVKVTMLALTAREILLIKRNSFVNMFKTFQVSFSILAEILKLVVVLLIVFSDLFLSLSIYIESCSSENQSYGYEI